MEHLNRLIRMVNASAEYERKAAEEKAMAEAATEEILAKRHEALQAKYESCAQAIATYCILPEKTFIGYRQNDKLYFLFTEFEGEEITRLSYKEDGRVCYAESRNDKVNEDTALVVWDTLQEYGVVSMDDLRTDYGSSDKEQWGIVLAHLKPFLREPTVKDKVLTILQDFGGITHGSNKDRHFAEFVNDASMEDDIISSARLMEDEKALANYFDTLVRKKVLNDIPTVGALKEIGVFVGKNSWKMKSTRRKANRK